MSTPKSSVFSVEAWETFWFRSIPSDIFSLLRIAFGAVGLISTMGLLPVSTFWSLDGIVPTSGNGATLRALALSADLGVIGGWALLLFLLTSFTCMAVGLGSSWAVLCCFAGSVFQSYWNPLPLSAAHDVQTVMLFCLLWADCGGRPSVDAWLRNTRKNLAAVDVREQAIAPLRLMRIQVALIYMNSALWKLLGPAWRDGSSIHYVLNLNTFHRIPGVVPSTLEPLLTVATYTTLIWEMTFGLLLLNAGTRRLALAFGVSLHVGLWATLELGPFSWVMLASYIAFLDPASVAERTRRWGAAVLTGTAQKAS